MALRTVLGPALEGLTMPPSQKPDGRTEFGHELQGVFSCLAHDLCPVAQLQYSLMSIWARLNVRETTRNMLTSLFGPQRDNKSLAWPWEQDGGSLLRLASAAALENEGILGDG